jgi:hypothetical protein
METAWTAVLPDADATIVMMCDIAHNLSSTIVAKDFESRLCTWLELVQQAIAMPCSADV